MYILAAMETITFSEQNANKLSSSSLLSSQSLNYMFPFSWYFF